MNSEKPIVGQEVEAYCGKCKLTTGHTITAMLEGETKKVICLSCHAQHNYRRPKGVATKEKGTTESAPKPVSAKKSVERTAKGPAKAAKKWAELVASLNNKPPQDYAMSADYQENSLISHKRFGLGAVTKRIDDTRVEVLFEDEARILVTNRR
ncbi:MAG: hypothetical protein HZA78_06870 [Candidatus Schekmanbacteria bacterium]|nr:hypothetical protein [Candidatus Schekmanbacteria bacterium]